MKRILFTAALLMPATAPAQTVAMRGLTNFPTLPRAEPFRETVFGVAIDDPYRWMEKADGRAALETWVNASSAHTTAELAALPGREALFKDMQALSRADSRYFTAQEAGGRLFYEKLAPDKQIPVLMVREGGKDRLLLDPMAGTDGKTPRAISSFSVSPDGRYVAIHIGEGGGETGAIRIYDVATGQPGADVLTPVWGEFRVGWIDDRTVTYTRLAPTAAGGDQMKNMVAYLHVLGTPVTRDVAVLGGSGPDHGFKVDPAQFPIVLPDPTSPWVLAIAANARAEIPIAVGRLADLRTGKPVWTKVADYDDRINSADIVGDTLYYLTSKTDENGELRAIDLAAGAPSLARSRMVMASGGRVLSGITATDSGLYVTTTLPSAASELWFLPRSGGAPEKLALPASQSINDMAVTPDRKAVTFAMGGYTVTDAYYRAVAGKVTPLGLANATPPSAKARTVVEEWANSADGTRVPLTIVYSGVYSGPRKGPAPTVIDAYGGYGVSGQPFYSSNWDVWNQRGGVYAYCHIRGGGELGEAWHRGGMLANKVNAHADLIACGERLVKLGYATPKTLGIFGSSAGGLLIPPSALKRPDLFAAVVTRVGIVNATRLAAANNGPNQYGEMGDPGTEAGFKALAAQDSTLLLGKAPGGTDFLFTIGLNDKRVDPWMSAKLAAMMRARWGDRHLVLIRSDGKAGHGLGSTRDQTIEERADIFAFFLNRFGAPGFVR
ncbi:prolyl oligopeptidase family serine peptidase [Sphingomonas sp. RP10(2022)]|uniref:prolyl oligopeptidase n=1 Tax=Sphingomonas liriopis TaxID=2949094 RepID=A0A9X2KU91_9SPHN|nr:prolyl oligopeptidase family serine peptidase [Sphingomonas liriopis]MCP3735733.1 prolyl oligopeptidase family serine peptidase [Sphingomonas liriopis]